MEQPKWKSFLLGGLAVCFALQPISTLALTVEVPTKLVNVKYPSDFQAKVDEIIVCLLEAESELYEADTLDQLPNLKTSDTRSCRDILKTKDYAENITFQVDYSKHPIEFEDGALIVLNRNKQASLTILESNPNLSSGVVLKSTESLEIAMRLFQDLNIGFYGELAGLHQEGDVLDAIYLRIFNLVYDLPKVQGHPLMIEFMKDVRDNYFRVGASKYFEALLHYAMDNNPDSELDEILTRYVVQKNMAGLDPGSQTPNENQPIISDSEDTTPPLTNPDDTAWGDLEDVWDEAYQDVVTEEDKEDSDKIYPVEEDVYEETLKHYDLENDVCMRTTVKYRNGEEVSRKTEKANSTELYRCGSTSVMGNSSVAVEEAGEDESKVPTLSYRYGSEQVVWTHTITKAKEGSLSYDVLSNLLMVIADEYGAGSLTDKERSLYVFEGKPLYLKMYEEPWAIFEINEWLLSENIPLTFGLDIEKQEQLDLINEALGSNDEEKDS